MSKPKSIKETYSDALYWAMSPQSKVNKYHLTRVNESILRKLIHYDRKNPKITYSNAIIAKHTFLDVSQIEKSIPNLNKIGFIKTITFQINDGSGKITSRRIININWDFISTVLAGIPVIDSIDDEYIEEIDTLEFEESSYNIPDVTPLSTQKVVVKQTLVNVDINDKAEPVKKEIIQPELVVKASTPLKNEAEIKPEKNKKKSSDEIKLTPEQHEEYIKWGDELINSYKEKQLEREKKRKEKEMEM